MTRPTPESFKTAEECLEYLKTLLLYEAIEFALQLRSDDFGHSCTTLLHAESFALQYIGEAVLQERASLKQAVVWPDFAELWQDGLLPKNEHLNTSDLSLVYNGCAATYDWLKERVLSRLDGGRSE